MARFTVTSPVIGGPNIGVVANISAIIDFILRKNYTDEERKDKLMASKK